jgi:hypothetical protein
VGRYYAVKKGDFYYIWCYADYELAEYMDNILTGPIDPVDRACNWRKGVKSLHPTSRTLVTS